MNAHLARVLGSAALAGLLQGAALGDDLPQSPACRTALQALTEAEDVLAASAAAKASAASGSQQQRSVAARLQPLRQRVADACLGGLTTSPPPSQHTGLGPVAPVRPALVMPRAPQPAAPPVALPRAETPVTVNHCNTATCVASDGSTLTRVGPTLVGPRGACRVDGVFLRCP
ncbi:hypothetical protein ACG04Q_08345 [Roseateles sp. DXS20W]|uniref:Uncharacterized protein n=1 Tax=Pelomonas lactea TaxID=3299030 RepID=A0ABW7GHZ1_9BURK